MTPSKALPSNSSSTSAARLVRQAKNVKVAATKVQTQALAWPSLVGDSSMFKTACAGQLGGQFVVGRLHRLGGAVLQQHHPAGTGRLVQNHAQEQGGPPLRLAEAGHEQTAESDQPRPGLAGRDTGGQVATGGAAAATDQSMPLVFGDDRLDFGQFPDLMPQRLRIDAGSVRRPQRRQLRRHTRDHVLALLDGNQRPFVLGVARLAAR